MKIGIESAQQSNRFGCSTPTPARCLVGLNLIFDDEQGKMGWNVSQANGWVLLVSQFTLMAQTQKGLRPDFGPAMPPAEAKVLYEQLVEYAQQQFDHVQTGIFAADMKVHLVNDGPVTFNLEIE